MAKKVIREIIIMLLLCIAVILLFGVVLYAYTPGNKTMPEKVSYVVPSDVKKELEQGNVTENEQVILTYEINSNDLTNYQRSNGYNPGKPNPFSSYQEEEVKQNTSTSGTTGTSTSGTTTSQATSTSNNSTKSNTTQGTSTPTSQSQTTTNTSPYVNNDKGTK